MCFKNLCPKTEFVYMCISLVATIWTANQQRISSLVLIRAGHCPIETYKYRFYCTNSRNVSLVQSLTPQVSYMLLGKPNVLPKALVENTKVKYPNLIFQQFVTSSFKSSSKAGAGSSKLNLEIKPKAFMATMVDKYISTLLHKNARFSTDVSVATY